MATLRQPGHLFPLGEGAYTVAETCRILGPTMTPRKVHYWLDTGLISGRPITRGRRGVPTVLTFRQLLEIRTVQYLRSTLGVSLPSVRTAFEWVLLNLFEHRLQVDFSRGPHGSLVAELPTGEAMTVPEGQHLLPSTLFDMTTSVGVTLKAWDDLELPIEDHPYLVTSTRVLGGAPTVAGTRIDTALIATFAGPERVYDDRTLAEVLATYPRLSTDQVEDALLFEGSRRFAAA